MTTASVIWWPTNTAAARMDVTKYQLMALMEQGFFTKNLHYREAGMDSGYAWDIEATRAAIRGLRG